MAYQVLLLLHILSFIMLMAGSILGARVTGVVRRTSGTRELVVLAQVARGIPMLTMPGSLGAMITGTILVWRQGYGFGAPWVSIAFTLWTLAFVIAIFGLGRTMGAAAPLLAKAVADGAPEAPEYQAALSSPVVFWSMRSLEVLSLLMIIDMVVKPGA